MFCYCCQTWFDCLTGDCQICLTVCCTQLQSHYIHHVVITFCNYFIMFVSFTCVWVHLNNFSWFNFVFHVMKGVAPVLSPRIMSQCALTLYRHLHHKATPFSSHKQWPPNTTPCPCAFVCLSKSSTSLSENEGNSNDSVGHLAFHFSHLLHFTYFGISVPDWIMKQWCAQIKMSNPRLYL